MALGNVTIGQPFAIIPLIGSITTGNERAEAPAVHLNEQHIGMVWKTNGTADAWLKVDLGSAQDIDFLSLMNASADAATTIRLRLGDTEAEVDGTAPYDSTALPFVLPAPTAAGTYHSHLELAAIESRRWARIDIGGLAGDFQAAQLVMGKRIISDRYYSPGFEFGVEDVGDIEFGRFGVIDSLPGKVYRTLRLRYEWTAEDVYDDQFRLLFQRSKTAPFYFCFEPLENEKRHDRTYYGWFNDSPLATGARKAGKMEMEISLISSI